MEHYVSEPRVGGAIRESARPERPRVPVDPLEWASMLRDIISVQVLGGHRLRLRFDDGVEGEVDLVTFLVFENVFAPLADPAYFATVRADPDTGTICWPNGADLDPLVLYVRITGRSIDDLLAAEEPPTG